MSVSCKDCIHHKVCLISDNDVYIDDESLRRDCKYFVNAADVAPVVHAEWELEHETYGAMRCSNCKKEAGLESVSDESGRVHLEYVRSEYCPNCGAIMDGERKEKE